jgi:predicted AAA+ superfamily ATPase
MRTLVIFRRLLDDEVVQAFLRLAEAAPADRVERYADFAYRLFLVGENFTDYVWRLIASNDNAYLRRRARRESVSDAMEACAARELALLQTVATVTSGEVKAEMPDMPLPDWATDPAPDFQNAYAARMERAPVTGYGMFADYTVFRFRGGNIVPVKTPDPIRLRDLSSYEREREKLVRNTQAFFRNRPVANALLYGDAGTGKSSAVKAVVNEFAHRGLRLVEVGKGDLLEIPAVVEALSDNPLKFILFVDDLSFSRDNEEIGALKAILEGSVCARTKNVAVYATSNRRYLVRENFSDRGGDDIHASETMAEQTSLSERFGLSILFAKPNKDAYLGIVRALAEAHGVAAAENLEPLAEQFALERGGRSGRTARQFVEHILRMQG